VVVVFSADGAATPEVVESGVDVGTVVVESAEGDPPPQEVTARPTAASTAENR